MIKIKNVAEYAGVSISSVSRYLNAPDSLREETRVKVQKAVEELNYSPNPLARSLRTKTTNTIAFVIPSLTNLYYVDLFSCLHRAATDMGYTVNMLTTNHDENLLRKYLRELPAQNIAGIIIAFLDEDGVVDDIRSVQLHMPVVLITSMPNRQDFNSVFVDALEGEMRATQHIIEKGCKRIAFVGGLKDNGPVKEKLRGFEAAMRKNNIPVDADLLFFDRNHFTTGFWAVRDFMAKDKLPDGIVCATDDIAIGCVKYLVHNGYQVPKDVKVIGFNGISLINAYEPSITSIRHPIEATSEEVVKLLHNRILYPYSKLQQITLYTTLVENTSTDPQAPVRFTMD